MREIQNFRVCQQPGAKLRARLLDLPAEYKNGVLEITAPLALTALPRKIEVKNVPAVKQVGA